MGSVHMPREKPKPIGGGPVDGGGPVVTFPTGPTRSKLPWKSGVSPGTGIGSIALQKFAEFGAWRGRDVDVGVVFIGKNSWTTSYAAFLTNEVLKPTGAVAAMVNVVGDGVHDPLARQALALAEVPEAHVHLYGKSARPDRKVGHVTVLGDDLDVVRSAANTAANLLSGTPRASR